MPGLIESPSQAGRHRVGCVSGSVKVQTSRGPLPSSQAMRCRSWSALERSTMKRMRSPMPMPRVNSPMGTQTDRSRMALLLTGRDGHGAQALVVAGDEEPRQGAAVILRPFTVVGRVNGDLPAGRSDLVDDADVGRFTGVEQAQDDAGRFGVADVAADDAAGEVDGADLGDGGVIEARVAHAVTTGNRKAGPGWGRGGRRRCRPLGRGRLSAKSASVTSPVARAARRWAGSAV